jgi:hypothetical protein
MIEGYRIVITGFWVAGLGPACAEPGPRERECFAGEHRANGECRSYRTALAGEGIKAIQAIEVMPADSRAMHQSSGSLVRSEMGVAERECLVRSGNAHEV